MSNEYQRGYSRGYYAGKKRGEEYAEKFRNIAYRIKRRAEQAEAEQGLGPCGACAHYTTESFTTAWGYCEPPQSDLGRPFFGLENNDSNRLVVSDNFGCPLFEKRFEES